VSGLGVTPQQQRCLDVLRVFNARHGRMPNRVELAQELGFASKSSTAMLLDGLEARGRIRRLKGRAYAIEIVERIDQAALLELLPAETRARLLTHCAESDDQPVNVIIDAVTHYLDAPLPALPEGEIAGGGSGENTH
jgi:SOS-response transcriptional repressor LexA